MLPNKRFVLPKVKEYFQLHHSKELQKLGARFAPLVFIALTTPPTIPLKITSISLPTTIVTQKKRPNLTTKGVTTNGGWNTLKLCT